MSPIYKLWMMKYRPAWYELGKTAQDELMGKDSENLTKVGARLLLVAASLWADEKWAAWGVEEYPSIEAVIQHAQALDDIHWFRYVKSWTILGISYQPDVKVVVPDAPIYRLALFYANENYYRLPEAEKTRWGAKHEALAKEVGQQDILACNATWCNEEWPVWSVEAYPNLEAVQSLRMKTYEAGWYQYVTATSLLGVKFTPG